MRVIWSPSNLCRGFFHPSSNGINIVSSNLSEKADGKIVPEGLTLVTDKTGRFCDLELFLFPERRLPGPLCPENYINCSDQLESVLENPECTGWFYEESSGELSITFNDRQVDSWVVMGSGSLVVGIRSGSVLAALFFNDVVLDASGHLESSWLNAVEAWSRLE